MARILMIVAAFAAFLAPAHASNQDKGVLADLISKALSTPATSVSIGSVDGVLSSNATVSDVVLSDRDGPWLKVDRIRLVWNRLALFSRRLEVDQLTLGRLELLRRPLPPETPPPENAGPQSILPELPLKVVVRQFAIEDLSLGEPVLGVAARLSVAGNASLGPPAEGLDLRLTSRRLDAPGAFSLVLTYVPNTDVLTLKVNSEEPAGGLFVHWVNLPGLPPAKLALKGSGPLDKFSAQLDFAAGADVWARGEIVVAREGAGRGLALNLNSRIESVFPSIVRPAFAGETTLKGDILFNDDSSVALPGGLHLVSESARLDFEGGKSAAGSLDLRIHAGAIPGSPDLGKLDLTARIMGPVDAPRVDGAFDAGDLRATWGVVGQASGSFRAAPTGSLLDEKTVIPFEGEVAVSSLVLADPALHDAIGGALALKMRGSANPAGEIAFDALDVSAASLDMHYVGFLGARKTHGKLDIASRDMSRFSRLIGGPLKGEAHIKADLDGAPGYGPLTAEIDGSAIGLSTPYPVLDRITGGELTLKGVVNRAPGGALNLSNLLALGDHGSARLDGIYGRDKVDLNATVVIPRAQVLDPRISGKVDLVAALTGTPSDLDANAKATLGDARLLDRPAAVTIESRAVHLMGPVEAAVVVSGQVDDHPLKGSAHMVKRDDGGWSLDQLALNLASVNLTGALTVWPDKLADGSLVFHASNLDDLSPLVLLKLSGSLQAEVEASSANGRQSLSIAADSARMAVGANSVEGLKIELNVGDFWGARSISGVARMARAEVAGLPVVDVRLTASGRVDESELDLAGAVRGLALKASGRLLGGAPIRFDLATLTAEGAGRKLTLAAPASFALVDNGVEMKSLDLRVDSGRLRLSGRVGSTLDVSASAVALPLSALDLLSPGLGVSGLVNGDAIIRGTPADPTGDWRVRVEKASLPQIRASSLPQLDVKGSGRLGGGRTSLDVALSAGGGNLVRITGSAPLSINGALDARIDGKLEAALVNRMLSASGRRAAGSLAIAMQLRGTVAKPQVQGTIRLSGGEFRDDEAGFKLTGISGVAEARGDAIRLASLKGQTPNGGSINATGEVRLDPAAGFPGAIRVTGTRVELASNDIVSATAGLALNVSGRLGEKPKIEGRIIIDTMDVAIPGSFNGVSDPISGTKHINPTPTARARLAQLAKAEAERASGPPFDATLALDLTAANRIFIRGRGIYAEMGGDLRLSGSARDPELKGGFSLLRGSLTLLGSRLDVTRGKIVFQGGWMPELDLLAETTAADVTARVNVSGPAAQPIFAITSTPSLPQDEILSRILFQRPSGSLSAFQALELANAAATLSGRGDLLEPLRKSLGLNSLGLGSGASGGLLGLGQAINSRLSVDVKTGVTSQENGVNLNVDVTRHIRLQAGVDASGGSSAGVNAEWEFK